MVSAFTSRTDNSKSVRRGGGGGPEGGRGRGPEGGGKMMRFEDGTSSGGVSQPGDDASSKVCICVLHIKLFFSPIYTQRNQWPCRCHRLSVTMGLFMPGITL